VPYTGPIYSGVYSANIAIMIWDLYRKKNYRLNVWDNDNKTYINAVFDVLSQRRTNFIKKTFHILYV
jgi:hypothetical protein